MKKDEILTLYKYNTWANTRILNATSKVSHKQLLASASFSYGGLRGTLVHTLFAEWIWRRRWEGHSPTEWLTPEDFPNFETLYEYWKSEEKELTNFGHSPGDIDMIVYFRESN